jgi:hypothetical protein
MNKMLSFGPLMKGFAVFLAMAAQATADPLPLSLPEAQVTGKVVDETGNPVDNANLVVNFLIPKKLEWGTQDVLREGLTGSDGTFTASEQSGNAAVLIATKAGYYKTTTGYYFFKEAVGGKWQPWNPTIKMVLKPILKPIPMYARKVYDVKIPIVSQPVGFDLMASDWVAPHGKGKVSDFIFTLEKQYTSVDQPFDVTLTLRFANEDDGIQSVFAPIKGGSELRLPRHAPEEGYQNKLIKSNSRKSADAMIQRDYRDDQNYFFRVRTMKKDDKIISAHYGKIDRDIEFWGNEIIRFTYYLNPTPNDRNMEFDPQRNLLTELKSREKVSAP